MCREREREMQTLRISLCAHLGSPSGTENFERLKLNLLPVCLSAQLELAPLEETKLA